MNALLDSGNVPKKSVKQGVRLQETLIILLLTDLVMNSLGAVRTTWFTVIILLSFKKVDHVQRAPERSQQQRECFAQTV